MRVSVLFNEPKLLKWASRLAGAPERGGFSALQRAEIAEIQPRRRRRIRPSTVSVLFNEPKLLKCATSLGRDDGVSQVSVLFNEPKLLKCCVR